MRERRALRFVVEALFLAALAAALVVADVTPLVIVGVMLAGWLVVALYEWAVTRELPHYGRGLPPRYYVPEVQLPPPRRLEQLQYPYPAAERDDQATWIATPAMRAEALAGWPVDVPADPAFASSPAEDTIVVDSLLYEGASGQPFHEDTWIELDPVAQGIAEAEAAPAVAEPEIDEPEVAAEPDSEPVEAVAGAVVAPVVVDEPESEARRRWRRGRRAPAEAAVVAAAAAELDEPVAAAAVEPEVAEPAEEDVPAGLEPPDPELPEPVAAAAVVDAPDATADPEVEEEEEEEETEEDVVVAVRDPVLAAEKPARHTFDPLGDDSPSRRPWRRRDDPYVELPERPPRPAVLPRPSRRDP